MADFTAKDVKALRDATGAGMMDAKKALTEADGDAEAATQILREKGLSKAAKRSDREASDGAVAMASDGGKVAVVLLRSETDFSAKSDDFVAVAQKLADAALAGDDPATACATDIEDLMLSKKENIDVGAVHIVEASEGNALDTYLHVQDGRGTIGIVVEGNGVDADKLHSIALHCAFANPRFLDKSEVSEDDVAKERTALLEITKSEGPTHILSDTTKNRPSGEMDDPTSSGTEAPRWGRIMLKVSGEAFAGDIGYGIDGDIVGSIAQTIASARDRFDVSIAVVVGGGNIWRGLSGAGAGMDRAQADYMGMLATVINGLALQEMLERLGVPTRVQTAIEMSEIAEPYIRRRAIRHLEKGRVVIFAGGTGNPFFTTDTAAALRAAEIDAEVLLKGTHSGIDGIYTADPKVDPTATKLDSVSYLDVLSKDLRAMDATATTLCMDNELPIVLFDLMGEDHVPRILAGEAIGTIVS